MQSSNPIQHLIQQLQQGNGGGEGAAVAGAMAVMLLIVGVALVVSYAILITLCWFVSSCLQRLPPEHRKQQPGLVWLLLIPCFNLVWNFFVFPKLAESYQSYFAAQGRTDTGDCGYGLAMTYCVGAVITTFVGMIPYVGAINCLVGPALLVVLIVFLVKAGSLKGQVQDWT